MKCKRRNDNKEFAVKILDVTYNTESEVKFLNMCKGHPSIVQTVDIFHDNNYTYIVMEYLNGGELLSRTKLTTNDLTSIALQIMNGINYLHEKGFAHCDIKPENILFVNNNSCDVKIIDFGCAINIDTKITTIKHDDDDDDNNKVDKEKPCFTLDYAAPEIVSSKYRHEIVKSNCCDVWSFGATLYRMTCMKLPFRYKDSDTDKQVKDRVCQAKYNTSIKSWQNLNNIFKEIIQSALRVSQNDRLTMQQLISILMKTQQKSITRNLLPPTVVEIDQQQQQQHQNTAAAKTTNNVSISSLPNSHEKSKSIDYNCNRKMPIISENSIVVDNNKKIEPIENHLPSKIIVNGFAGFNEMDIATGYDLIFHAMQKKRILIIKKQTLKSYLNECINITVPCPKSQYFIRKTENRNKIVVKKLSSPLLLPPSPPTIIKIERRGR